MGAAQCSCVRAAEGQKATVQVSASQLEALRRLDAELLELFRTLAQNEAARDGFRSCGRSDAALIEVGEFETFLQNKLAWTQPVGVQRLYDLLSVNDGGRLTWGKLQASLKKALGKEIDAKSKTKAAAKTSEDRDARLLKSFEDLLKNTTKSRKDAFRRLGAADDDVVSSAEFDHFLRQELGYTCADDIQRLFILLDDDKDGNITWLEFRRRLGDNACVRQSVASVGGAESNELLLWGFEQALRKVCKSKKEAFSRLGGADDALVSMEEFEGFLRKEMGYASAEDIKRLFVAFDDNKDGKITWVEFRTRLQGEGGGKTESDAESSAILAEFEEALRQACKSRKDAFNRLGGSDDDLVSTEEFDGFLRKDLGYSDAEKIRKIFFLLDTNNDGDISWSEFRSRLQSNCDDSAMGKIPSRQRRKSISSASSEAPTTPGSPTSLTSASGRGSSRRGRGGG